MKPARVEWIVKDPFPASTDPGAAAYYLVFTVPDNEYWEVLDLRIITSAATTKVRQLRIVGPQTGFDIVSDPAGAETADLSVQYNPPKPFPPGFRLYVNVTTYNAGDTISPQMYYRRTVFQR